MNDFVIDRRIFLQNKKRNHGRSLLPEIKYPAPYNINGSSILHRINEEIANTRNQTTTKSRSQCQPPLSNILISKRIMPGNPEESPLNFRKKNHAKRDFSSKIILDS